MPATALIVIMLNIEIILGKNWHLDSLRLPIHEHSFSLLFFRSSLITFINILLFLSFSHSVVSNSFWPHELQHIRLPCPSLFPRVCSNSIHLVSDSIQFIQPSHSLLPSSIALNLSQHQSLFQWIGSSHQVAEVLELQHQSFWWILRADFL